MHLPEGPEHSARQRLIFCRLALIALAWMNGCSNAAAPTHGPSSVEPPANGPTRPVMQGTSVVSTPDLTARIGDILSNPDQYQGLVVEITGTYRGWDLLKEVKGTPPVTRSDWVIADDSGAIYVTGPSPEGLDPSSPKDAWTLIRLVATVEYSQGDVYLKAQSVELVGGK